MNVVQDAFLQEVAPGEYVMSRGEGLLFLRDDADRVPHKWSRTSATGVAKGDIIHMHHIAESLGITITRVVHLNDQPSPQTQPEEVLHG